MMKDKNLLTLMVTFKIGLTAGHITCFSLASCIKFPREIIILSNSQPHFLARSNPSILLKTNHFQLCLIRESCPSIIVTKSIDILTFCLPRL